MKNDSFWPENCSRTGNVKNPKGGRRLLYANIRNDPLFYLERPPFLSWRESDDGERLCAGNGLLLTPSIDHLFDCGFISFDDSVDLITSPVAEPISLKRMGVNTEKVINVGMFNSDQKSFLEYRRRESLLKSAS